MTTPPNAAPVAPTHVAVPVALVQALADYLVTKPYAEVVPFVNGLAAAPQVTLGTVPTRPALVPDATPTPPAAP